VINFDSTKAWTQSQTNQTHCNPDSKKLESDPKGVDVSEPKDPQRDEAEPFGVLLERLIYLKKHDNGRSYTVPEVAEDIGISKSQLYNLIKGSNEPKLRLAQELSTYFDVELEYFGNSERARQLQGQYAMLERLSEQGVRDIAFRASALSPEVLPSVLDFIDFQASRGGENHTSG